MAKLAFINNWFKKTALPLFAFPYESLFSADAVTDMKYFLMYADKNAVSETAITEECLTTISDEYAEKIECILASLDYTEDEKLVANGELNVCLVSVDMPDKMFNKLNINTIAIFFETVVSYMTRDNEDMNTAVTKACNDILM